MVTELVVIDDIKYRTGMYVFLEREKEQLVCGEIMLILVHDCKNPFLVTSVRNTRFLSYVGLHEIC
jgi:hypothetical protein